MTTEPTTPATSTSAAHPSDNLVERLRALPTAAISDALDTIGIEGALHGIAPLVNGITAVGPAFTVQYAPAGTKRGSVGDFLDDVPAGSVVVIDNQARTDVTVWGGIMTEVAHDRRIAGTVINGVCRDVATSLEHDYPLFSVSRYMRTGKDRVQLVAVAEPLTIGDVTVKPGDIVCADSDGAVVVPKDEAEHIAEVAERIEATEAAIVAEVTNGSTLVEARAALGYHDLQKRNDD